MTLYVAHDSAGLPENVEAEQAVLGTMLLNNRVGLTLQEMLSAEDFGTDAHQLIYRAASRFILEGRKADAVTLAQFFKNEKTLTEVGGNAYLGRLVSHAVLVHDVEHYARIVRDLAQRRGVIAACQEALAAARTPDPDEDAEDVVDALETSLAALRGGVAQASGMRSIGAVLEAMAGGTVTPAISTGLARLDELIGGLKRGHLVILGGRPSMGKSAVALAMAMNVAKEGRGVGFVSLEMTGRELTQRAACDLAYTREHPIHYFRVERNRISDDERERLRQASDILGQLPLFIDDAGGATMTHIRSRARRLKGHFEGQGRRLDLLVVDHLTLIKDSGRWRDNRTAAITEISAALKELAKELDCCVLAPAQLSRDLEKRDVKRPTLADLRESGAIEQDADVVMFVFRDSYYHGLKKPEKGYSESHRKAMEDWQTRQDEIGHDLELIVRKQRGGPLGTAMLWTDIGCNVIRDEPPAVEEVML